jgi:hypothetical protein
MQMNAINIDWKAIRPLNGSQANGFEELCAQLARAENLVAGSRFVRKGTPDAGVECYAVLPDGSEWGWQAKYFNGLGKSQWQQLDDSVKTAIHKHPRLIRYYVCIPMDFPDARLENKHSTKDHWDKHVEKWTDWASACKMKVEFVYWGNSELIDRFSCPENVGRLYFWFNARVFDSGWFRARLDEAVKTAGPRYTPEIHFDLPISAEFESFGRTERFFDQVKAMARGIRQKLQSLEHFESKTAEQTLEGSLSALFSQVKAIIAEIGAVTVQPTGPLPFRRIADKLENLLLEQEQEFNTISQAKAVNDGGATSRSNPFKKQWHHLMILQAELWKIRGDLLKADTYAGGALMILSGEAGTGKTHLLCDVAQRRLAEGRPTILLMGQQFIKTDAPWPQALQLLDLPDLSAEKFVGALEAAAKAANCRALLMIDAINEGEGRSIWPNHLAAFLAHLLRSPWIGVLLSIRSSYMEYIIPEQVSKGAVLLLHQGFAGHEYDATRALFAYYGIEEPSAPILAPEFSNPLFLKTLCRGLQAKGERRLPRGFLGITSVFDLYLNAINDRLSRELDFDPGEKLVRKALEALAKELAASRESWLPKAKAKEIVGGFLPGRRFWDSLYQSMVVEGLLLEEAMKHQGKTPEEFVVFAYERLSDHFIAKTLLDNHLESDAHETAFAPGGPLAFLWDGSQYVSSGLLEALCIQIPERTGQELVILAPEIMDHSGIGYAFRQSLNWRAPEAISKETIEVLNKLTRNEDDLRAALDVLLTMAALPEHALNANFLDHKLRQYQMPDRDAWWSTYLHRAWGSQGAVDMLVDWASSVPVGSSIDEQVVDLSAVALAWMLAASNRYLRDLATQGLVNLLTYRLNAVVRLVEKFAEIDDLYIAERIYAVAYGVAMRSHDPIGVGALAKCVYARVFADGTPPAHILLRDYARGVVERAIYLNASIEVVPELIRPPYKSQWPTIPTEDDIKPFLPDWSRGSYDSEDIEWARNRIYSSVMHDDFGRYIIGTNSLSMNWLSLRLDEPEWQSPSKDEMGLPRFDLKMIQRYILWRVFDLGWTKERFGEFDRFSIVFQGGAVSKTERIGKKYQWIAFHEITALVADHFQYREEFRREDGDRAYIGPWQEYFRDIDPSCAIRTSKGATWNGDSPSWWVPISYEDWGDPDKPDEWASRSDDLPSVEKLLSVTNPEDGSRWINLHGFFKWRQEPPPDRDPYEIEQRDLYYLCNGYLVGAAQAKAFIDWAKGVDFWNRWMPEPPSNTRMFLGEYGWSPAFRYFGQPFFGNDGWNKPGRGCPAKLLVAAYKYLRESAGADGSVDRNYELLLPTSDLLIGLGLRWNGRGAEHLDQAGRLAAFDPSAHALGPSALLFREDLLTDFLAREKLTIVWAVFGEKMAIDHSIPPTRRSSLRISDAYTLKRDVPSGFLKVHSELLKERHPNVPRF